jgi:hypothetical protein
MTGDSQADFFFLMLCPDITVGLSLHVFRAISGVVRILHTIFRCKDVNS